MLRNAFLLGWIGLPLVSLFAEPIPPLPNLTDTRVSIPYSELKELWQAAQPKPPVSEEAPPVAAVISLADYSFKMGKGQLLGEARFQVESFSKTWTWLPLLPESVQIEKVEPEGALITLHENGYQLLLKSPQRVSVKVRFAMPADGLEQGGELKLNRSSALISRLTLPVPGENQEWRVTPSTDAGTEAQAQTFRLLAGHETKIALLSKEKGRPELPSQWTGIPDVAVQIEDGKLHFQSQLNVTAPSGSGLDLKITIPEQARNLTVSSEDLESKREYREADGRRKLVVRWKTRDILSRTLRLDYQIPQNTTQSDWKLEVPQVDGGATTVAVFGVLIPDGLELTAPTVVKPENVRLPGSWLRGVLRGKNHLLVCSEAGAMVKATWLPMVDTARSICEVMSAKTRLVTDGAFALDLSWKIRHSGATPFLLEIPAGVRVIACSVNKREARPIQRKEHLIEIPLGSGNGSEFTQSEIRLSYVGRSRAWDKVKGRVEVLLPKTEVMIEKINWDLVIPADYELTAFEGNLVVKPGETSEEGLRLVKELCQGDLPAVELFYQKRDSKN